MTAYRPCLRPQCVQARAPWGCCARWRTLTGSRRS